MWQTEYYLNHQRGWESTLWTMFFDQTETSVSRYVLIVKLVKLLKSFNLVWQKHKQDLSTKGLQIYIFALNAIQNLVDMEISRKKIYVHVHSSFKLHTHGICVFCGHWWIIFPGYDQAIVKAPHHIIVGIRS